MPASQPQQRRTISYRIEATAPHQPCPSCAQASYRGGAQCRVGLAGQAAQGHPCSDAAGGGVAFHQLPHLPVLILALATCQQQCNTKDAALGTHAALSCDVQTQASIVHAPPSVPCNRCDHALCATKLLWSTATLHVHGLPHIVQLSKHSQMCSMSDHITKELPEHTPCWTSSGNDTPRCSTPLTCVMIVLRAQQPAGGVPAAIHREGS